MRRITSPLSSTQSMCFDTAHGKSGVIAHGQQPQCCGRSFNHRRGFARRRFLPSGARDAADRHHPSTLRQPDRAERLAGWDCCHRNPQPATCSHRTAPGLICCTLSLLHLFSTDETPAKVGGWWCAVDCDWLRRFWAMGHRRPGSSRGARRRFRSLPPPACTSRNSPMSRQEEKEN